MLDRQRIPAREFAANWRRSHSDAKFPLTANDADAPQTAVRESALVAEWAATAHAAAGVNCSACHKADATWNDELAPTACQACHEHQVESFQKGRHGMRLAVGLSPMKPSDARLPMRHDAAHRELTCISCHGAHKFDTHQAAVDACLTCHDDKHSRSYKQSTHFALWQQELDGHGEPGSGVSCATCHMPREKHESGEIFVQHNQNDNLRPNDKMILNACQHCHGLQFSLDALADRKLIENNFQGTPKRTIESIAMAKAWADQRERLRQERNKKRNNNSANSKGD